MQKIQKRVFPDARKINDMNLDFTLDKYKKICQAVIDAGYEIMTVRKYLQTTNPISDYAILRHDVDRNPGSAQKMARLENSLGLASTYYFRYTRNVFKSDIIKNIASMGHEIGYHYETLSKTNGNFEKAIEVFKIELAEFRKICEVNTISMHGKPFSKWDNRELWSKYDFTDLDLIGEAYLSIDYDKVQYFCDTGRTWDSKKYNIRDHVKQDDSFEIDKTDELISLLFSKTKSSVCISSHPNRWAYSNAEWFGSYLSDWLINRIKLGISLCK